MAEGVTVANAYVQIMPSAQGAKESITGAILPAAEEAGDSAGSSLGSHLLAKIGELKGPIAAIGGTVLGAIGVSKIAGALMDIGSEFDSMRDTIIIGTGASGEALESLVGSAESIATTVPVSFEEAGDIVQNVNTRMGLVGDELEDVGNRVAALGELTGKAINMDSLTGSLNAFGVAGDEAAGKMDYLWGVSQNTGIGFDQLTGILESNAPALQALGFSFESSANMAGLLDKAGLDASGTMGKMGKALVELAEPGESAEDAFHRVVDSIGEYIEQGDTASALDVASKVFGTKGATQFVAAVESGSLSLEELTDTALGAGDGIMGTMDATMDWPEKWELIKNSAKQALEPMGGALMDAATTAMEHLTDAMGEIDPAVFEELGTMLGEVLSGAVDVLSDALTFLVEHKEQIGAFFDGIVNAIQLVIDIIGPLISGFLDVASKIPSYVETVKTKLSSAWGSIKSKVTQTWDNIKTKLSDTWNNIKTTVSTSVDNVKTKLSDTWNNIKSSISSTVDGIKSKISDTFSNIKSTASNTWNGIKSAIEGPINSARDAVKSAIDKIKGFFSFNIQWPHIPLPHFSISGSANPLDWITEGVPSISIEWWAKGGYVDEPTVLNVAGERGGELVWPSYEPYLSRYAGAIVDEMGKRGDYDRNGGVIVTGNTFIVRQESDITAIGRAINDEARRREWSRL